MPKSAKRQIPQKIIELKSDCEPLHPVEPITHLERDVRWTRIDGGVVQRVRIPNGADYFDLPGNRDGKDYVIHYKGTQKPPPFLTWDYSPKCKQVGKKPQVSPQMTNGGG